LWARLLLTTRILILSNIFILLLSSLFLLFIHLNFLKISILANIYDNPKNIKRKRHKNPVPLLGGLIILLNLFIISLVLLLDKFFNFHIEPESYFQQKTFGIFFVIHFFGFLIFLIGVFDDKYNVSGNLRLILMTILLVVFFLLYENFLISKIFFSNNFVLDLRYLSFFLTVLCFLVFLNSLNMLDGVNNLLSSYLIIIFLIFLFKGVYPLFCLLILLSLFFFSYLNYKTKCFMGSNGSYFLGFCVAIILISQHNEQKIYAEEVINILFLPVIDLFRIFSTRTLNNKPFYQPDLNHIHHLLKKKFNAVIAVLLLSSQVIVSYIVGFFFSHFIGIFFSLIIYVYFLYLGKVKK
jgi:UDP-GlcNAc:undecaprenyl-phosphate GlcNAc-1-phosphate transferase